MKRLIAVLLARKNVLPAWIAVALLLLFGTTLAAKPKAWAAPVSHSPNQNLPELPFDTRLPKIEVAPTPVPTATPVTPPDSPPPCFPTACQLTDSNGNQYPIWSPDGRTIAYFAANGVYRMFGDGSHQVQLANCCSISMQWSPDGSKLAATDNARTLYIIKADGSSRTTVSVGDFYIFSPQWSPDGSKILFEAKTCCVDTSDLYTVDADGSHQALLFSGANFYATPSWSPDGSKILLGVPNNGVNDIYTIHADGSNLTKLIGNTQTEPPASWSPDGSKILFINSIQVATGEVYVMNANGSNPINLTNHPWEYFEASWSPDGKMIAFPRDASVFAMKADGSGVTDLYTADTYLDNIVWSPDSSKVLFIQNIPPAGSTFPGGPGFLYVAKADGTQTSELYVSNGAGNSFNINSASWSPSGRHIAFSSQGTIFVVGLPQ